MSNSIHNNYRTIWEQEKNIYDSLGNDIKVMLLKILKNNGISANVTYRVKDIDSIIKKIARKNTEYENIHDKVGIRIVIYFKEQLDIINGLLYTYFDHINHYNIVKREDMTEKLGDNEFGYQSIHYDICKVIDEKAYYCELQLRTICQDNWSVISHELAYKSEIDIPKNIMREINALSAVFELADNQFQLIQTLINNLPDSNPIKILNFIEKYYYTNLGDTYDKELTSLFMKNIMDVYDSENPIKKLEDFISIFQNDIINKVLENYENIFFTQPEILIILERIQNSKYNFTNYWDTLFEIDELETIANIWGTSIY